MVWLGIDTNGVQELRVSYDSEVEKADNRQVLAELHPLLVQLNAQLKLLFKGQQLPPLRAVE